MEHGDRLSETMIVEAEVALSDIELRRRHERRWAQDVLDLSVEMLPWFQELDRCTSYAVLVPVSTRLGRRVQAAAFPSGALIGEGPSRYGYYLTCNESLVHASTGHRVDYRLVHPQMVFGLVDLMDAGEEEWMTTIADHLRASWRDMTSALQPGT